jgi:hypothetical protein
VPEADRRGRAVEDARALVAEWFPDARAAWLGGSLVLGLATPGSDLDVTVLLPGPPAPFRESRHFGGWPVELFVHTETSLRHYLESEAAAGKPTMPRLVGAGVLLTDTDGSGSRWRARAKDLLDAGPPPLGPDDLATARYGVSDGIDDIVHARDGHELLASATETTDAAARLLLRSQRHWSGRGKWLVRELRDLDARSGTRWAHRHDDALRAAVRADVSGAIAFATAVLDRVGGPLFEGHRQAGTDPAAPRPDGPA